jgi:hypothetical protein
LRKEVKYIPALFLILATLYYIALCVKDYSWIFTSADSGDFLAASTAWMIPQPYGEPLYILLGRLISLLPLYLPASMTILLSAIPAGITVMLTYLTTREITKRPILSIVAPLILMGSVIFLTEASVTKQYSLSVMFLTLALYCYVKGWLMRATIALALGASIHVVIFAISVFWFALNIRNKSLWKCLPVYILIVGAFYAFTLWMFDWDIPPMIAGQGLTIEAVQSWLASTKVFGTLALHAFPERILRLAGYEIMCFGLSLPLAWYGLFIKRNILTGMMLSAVAFGTWYFATCLDPTTWTYLSFTMPILSISAVMALNHLTEHSKFYTYSCVVSSVVLIGLNAVFMNGNVLAQQNPLGPEYKAEIDKMPDNSVIVIHRGGPEFMAFMYSYSQGKKLIPVFFRGYAYTLDKNWSQYLAWLNEKHGVAWGPTENQVKDELSHGTKVFVLLPILNQWDGVFQLRDIGNKHFSEVTAVIGNPNFPVVENK